MDSRGSAVTRRGVSRSMLTVGRDITLENGRFEQDKDEIGQKSTRYRAEMVKRKWRVPLY